MGRRYNGQVPAEMLEDLGIPGKLYFEKPQVIELAVKRDERSNQVITTDLHSTEGPCRLKSTLSLHDFKKKGENIEYQCSLRPTLEEIHEYLRLAEIQGFGMGAVVARRHCADWRWETPYAWGVILGQMAYVPSQSSDVVWAPFTIRWFDKQMGEEPAWAEDLYVIHQCLSKDLVASIVEEQVR